jgi:cell division protease FtsH
MRKVPLAPNVDPRVIARGTPGFSGADLANLVNEAALRAARFNKMKVDMADFEFAKDKVMMGSERRSLVMSEQEKRITAYHEAGHALVAALLPEADPLHKVTIIPRGMALGLTQQLPLEDRYTYSRAYLEANLRVLMGGRIAEEIVFGSDWMTTGAGNDLERATELSRKMVCEWGMSPAMGPMTFGKREESIFLGKEFSRHQDYSDATAVKIDDEIGRFVSVAYEDSHRVLEHHRVALEAIAAALLEHEVLDGDTTYDLIGLHSDVNVDELRHLKQRLHPAVVEPTDAAAPTPEEAAGAPATDTPPDGPPEEARESA